MLKVAQDAYKGDAQFIVKVDGQQVGDVHTAKASYAEGAWDLVSVSGDFANAHQVSVSFVNDLWGGTGATDRNLYVESVNLDGHAVKGSIAVVDKGAGQHLGDVAALWGNGSAVFNTSDLNNGTHHVSVVGSSPFGGFDGLG